MEVEKPRCKSVLLLLLLETLLLASAEWLLLFGGWRGSSSCCCVRLVVGVTLAKERYVVAGSGSEPCRSGEEAFFFFLRIKLVILLSSGGGRLLLSLVYAPLCDSLNVISPTKQNSDFFLSLALQSAPLLVQSAKDELATNSSNNNSINKTKTTHGNCTSTPQKIAGSLNSFSTVQYLK